MNPEAPAFSHSENFGTERDVANCPFFLKTGACRFGDRYRLRWRVTGLRLMEAQDCVKTFL